MQTVQVGQSGLAASRIVQGCMRFDEISQEETTRLVAAAHEAGINMFDNADIYGGGECETKCGQALREASIPREDVIIQTKCGIENYMYDFSREHILKSVDASLRRLGTEYVDILLLHRPDALADPAEVAQALDLLHQSGKVRHFGVSNMNPMQIELYLKYLGRPLVANQLQFSAVHTGMVDSGILVNTKAPGSVMRDGSVLEYCRLKDITIQAWSPFQKGHMEGTFLGDAEYPELNECINRLAAEKGTNANAIAAAWLLRHPAGIQVVVGTTKPAHLLATCEALDHPLTHDEWYAMYTAAGNLVP